jgi:hypothetical protein
MVDRRQVKRGACAECAGGRAENPDSFLAACNICGGRRAAFGRSFVLKNPTLRVGFLRYHAAATAAAMSLTKRPKPAQAEPSFRHSGYA